jgi:hypothetical protein
MELSQGNSLCSYLKQIKNVIFFFYKIREKEGRKGPVWVGAGEELVPVREGGGGGESVWEGEYSANTVYTCT